MFDFLKKWKPFKKPASGIDIVISSSTTIGLFAISIGVRLKPVPAEWSFLLLVNGHFETPQLALKAPIAKEGKENLHTWLEKKAERFTDLPVQDLYQQTLSEIKYLEGVEKDLRENHKLNQKVISSNKGKSAR